MPLTSAPGSVEASPMEGVKAMAIAAEIGGRRLEAARDRRPVARSVDADRCDVRFTASAVIREALGGRTWRGTLTNVAGRPCLEVEVRVRFHDRAGRPVGSPLGARARWLAPGAALHLQSRLPAEAAGLRVEALRWAGGGGPVHLQAGADMTFRGARD